MLNFKCMSCYIQVSGDAYMFKVKHVLRCCAGSRPRFTQFFKGVVTHKNNFKVTFGVGSRSHCLTHGQKWIFLASRVTWGWVLVQRWHQSGTCCYCHCHHTSLLGELALRQQLLAPPPQLQQPLFSRSGCLLLSSLPLNSPKISSCTYVSSCQHCKFSLESENGAVLFQPRPSSRVT